MASAMSTLLFSCTANDIGDNKTPGSSPWKTVGIGAGVIAVVAAAAAVIAKRRRDYEEEDDEEEAI